MVPVPPLALWKRRFLQEIVSKASADFVSCTEVHFLIIIRLLLTRKEPIPVFTRQSVTQSAPLATIRPARRRLPWRAAPASLDSETPTGRTPQAAASSAREFGVAGTKPSDRMDHGRTTKKKTWAQQKRACVWHAIGDNEQFAK